MEYIDAVRRHSRAPVVYYGHDIHHLRLEREYEVARDPALPAHAGRVRRIEEQLWSGSDLVLYPAPAETAHVAGWLRDSGAGGTAATVPLFAYEGDFEPVDDAPQAIGARRDVVFVGGYAHAPNEDGAVWFAREAWPIIRAQAPGLRLVLAGADPGRSLRELECDDIVVPGRISEAALLELYAGARLAIAPLRFGAGVKGKVVEAMRHGVPCVTTTVGAQGLEDAGCLRVADSADGFAALALSLLDDAAWREASREGQAYVRARFSVDAVWDVLARVMDDRPYPDVEARLANLRPADA